MKLKLLFLIGIAAVCGVFLSGCSASKGNADNSVPYQFAEHYFVNNNVEGMPHTTITSAAEFEKYFGMAAIMGKNGTPTEIDFSKSFVICLTVAPTDTQTSLSVVYLTKSDENQLVLSYKITRGEKMSYTYRPLLLLVVDKKYELPVVLEATGK